MVQCQPARSRGFSLLEVLVAFVILSLVATALFRLFSASLSNASAATDYSRAVLVAESRLEAAAAAQPLVAGDEQGTEDEGRIAWESRVEPYESAADAEDPMTAMLPTMLYRISVDVKFTGPNGGPRTFSLATLRIGARNPT
jgi:general secretion pathway protein I